MRWPMTKATIVDELFVCGDDHVHSEGYRLLWYRSTRKAEQDQSRRARSIQKGTEALGDLRERLQGPRTRFRERSKVEQAVAEVLAEAEASPGCGSRSRNTRKRRSARQPGADRASKPST